MKMRKIPMRTCVVTREKCEKKDLLRVVRDNNGNVFVESSASAVLKTKTASIEVENQLDIKATTVKIESKVDTTIVSPSISLDSSAGHTKITSARGEKSF